MPGRDLWDERSPSVLLLGAGNLGGHLLDMLLRRPDAPRLTVAARDGETLCRRVNLARLTAAQLGFHHEADVAVVDLDDTARTAEVLAAVRPDVVLTTASRQASWVVDQLPSAARVRLNAAQLGPWLPMHLAPLWQLMSAVAASGIETRVINAAFPDATHPALDGAGLAPLVGIGNVANPVPALRHAIADHLGFQPEQVSVRLVASHFAVARLPRLGHTDGAPYHLAAHLDGVEVTDKLDVPAVLAHAASRYRRLGGRSGGMLTAATAMTVLDAVLADHETVVHAPGPQGLPGGYPLRVSRRGVRLALPTGVSFDDALAINETGLRHDGIRRIDPGGTVYFEEQNAEIMRLLLGYDCRTLPLVDVVGRADELGRRFAEFRDRRCTAMSRSG